MLGAHKSNGVAAAFLSLWVLGYLAVRFSPASGGRIYQSVQEYLGGKRYSGIFPPPLPTYGVQRLMGLPINTEWEESEVSFAADGTIVCGRHLRLLGAATPEDAARLRSCGGVGACAFLLSALPR